VASFTSIETFHVETCWQCGIAYAFPIDYEQKRRADHQDIYCPNGHVGSYQEKSQAQKERERADRLSRSLESRDRIIAEKDNTIEAQRRSHAATKGQLTKVRKRIAAGICPCCHRTFAQVTRHMKNQHPEYVEDQRG